MSVNNQELLPQPEISPPQSGGGEQAHDNVEVPASREKDAKQPVTAAPAPQAASVPVPTSPTTPAPLAPPDSSAQIKHTDVADDVDLIEKEWVDRAKAIVEATQDDPHKQKSEISKVKAEYIQKRFNKTIKVDTPA